MGVRGSVRRPFWAGVIAAGPAVWVSVGSGGERGWGEAARGGVGGLEGGRGRQAGGETQDDLPGVVDDAGRDAEQHPAHKLGLAAAREVPWGLGAEHEVVEQREEVERQGGAVQPDAVGVQVGQGQPAQG